MLGAVVFGLGAAFVDPTHLLRIVAGVGLGATLGVLTAIDLATHTLPNRIQYPLAGALAAVLLVSGLLGDRNAWTGLVSGGAVFLGFFLLALLGGGALGLGDVKLGLVLGMWAGWFGPTVPVLFVIASFLVGGVVAVVLMLTRRATRTTHIAFGPFLVTGAAIATLWTAVLTAG